MSSITEYPVASDIESSETTSKAPVSTTLQEALDALIAANPAQALTVLAEYMKKAAKAVTKQPKRKGSMPKGETPKQLNDWANLVTATLEKLRLTNPKATRKEAMEVAAVELDKEDPEGAPKRAAAREKRAEAALKKKAAKAQTTSIITKEVEKKPRKPRAPKEPKTTAAAPVAAAPSTVAPASGPKPGKVLKKKAPEPETLPVDIEIETTEFNGTEYLKNMSGNNTYFWESNEDGSIGPYVGRFDEKSQSIDVTYPEPEIASE